MAININSTRSVVLRTEYQARSISIISKGNKLYTGENYDWNS